MNTTVLALLSKTQKQSPNGTATVPPVKPVKYSQGGASAVKAVDSLKMK